MLLQTRVLVTHGLGFLPQCDLIVVMDDGKIIEVGSYDELLNNSGHFAEFIRTYGATDENEEEEEDVDGFCKILVCYSRNEDVMNTDSIFFIQFSLIIK